MIWPSLKAIRVFGASSVVDKMIASDLAEHTPLKSLLRPVGLPLTRASLPSPLPSIEPAAPTPNAHRVDLGQRHSEADSGAAGQQHSAGRGRRRGQSWCRLL